MPMSVTAFCFFDVFIGFFLMIEGVLATKTINDTVDGIYRISYPKLCVAMDLKNVYGFLPTFTKTQVGNSAAINVYPYE